MTRKTESILLFLLMLVLFVGSAWAEEPVQVARMNPYILGGSVPSGCTDANPVGNCTGFLICQNFETTAEACDPCSEDNSETWDKYLTGTGAITVDYNAAALRGSESCQVDADGATTSYIDETFSNSSTVYVFFRIYLSDGQPATAQDIFQIYNGGAKAYYLNLRTSTTGIRVYHGTALNTVSSATLGIVDGPGTYYVWAMWGKDTEVDDTGLSKIAVSTTRTFPGWQGEFETGTYDDDVNLIRLTDVGIDAVYDQVLVKTTAIGTVCE